MPESPRENPADKLKRVAAEEQAAKEQAAALAAETDESVAASREAEKKARFARAEEAEKRAEATRAERETRLREAAEAQKLADEGDEPDSKLAEKFAESVPRTSSDEEAEEAITKLRQIAMSYPSTTPNEHILFGANGIRVTLGDLRNAFRLPR